MNKKNIFIKNIGKQTFSYKSFSFQPNEVKLLSDLTEEEKKAIKAYPYIKDITEERLKELEPIINGNVSSEILNSCKKELEEVKIKLSQTEEIAEKSSKENEKLIAENSKLKKELEEVKKTIK